MELYRQVQNLLLIVQPGDSFFPLVDAIDKARHTIKMTIFRMDDPIVRDALSHAVARNVEVKALIAPTSKGWSKRNKKLTHELSSLGIEIRTPKPLNEKIERYHYKMMTIDNRQSLILTFNPTQKNMHYARDFGLFVRDDEITTELNRLFDADWRGEPFQPSDSPLVISPSGSREKLLELLASAERSIRIMDAKLREKEMIDLLMAKAAAGCAVKIISQNPGLTTTGASLQVKKLSRYKLHAKCILVDSERFFIGSQNLRKSSLERRREVGIMVQDLGMGQKIARVFDEDWASATDLLAALKTEA